MESVSNKFIIIKFSELHLKGGNKKEFVKVLLRNIKYKFKLNKLDAKILEKRDRFEIYSDNISSVPKILNNIVGISVYSHAIQCKYDKELIEKILKNELNGYKLNTKFRVSVKIVDKDFSETKENLINWLAWYGTNILKFSIDLSNYDLDLNFRIENKVVTLILDKNVGIYGLPAGSNGKALALLSGGIDSPVAAFKTITRGMNVSFLTFLTPKTSDAQTISKIKDLAKKVNEYNGVSGKLFIVNFERIQEKIMALEDSSYRIILLRRYFMKFAKIVSMKNNYKFLITGDSLGQVASQTPESMAIINNSIDKLIIRPLVSSSKNEIINLASKIGTYEISIRKGDDMCSLFTPKNPIIFPKKYVVEELESKLENMEDLLWSIFREDTRIIEL